MHQTVKRLIVCASFCALGWAGEAPATKPIAEIHALKLENIALRERLLQQGLEQLRKEASAVAANVCKQAAIPVDACVIDMEKRVVSQRPAGPEKAPGEMKQAR